MPSFEVNDDSVVGSDDAAVLVTGATGFVALHVIQLLQREGYKVRGTVRSLKNESKLKPLRSLCPEAKYPLELVEADLTKDEGWDEAARGCRYCMHVASPFPNEPPKTPDDILLPAVEGTKRVLQACVNAGTLKRVVLTSSIAAVFVVSPNEQDRIFTEEDWGDAHTDTYMRSKTMAERAAWDFVAALPPEEKIELSVINPSGIMGPCIGGVFGTSVEIIQRAMNFWSLPIIPKLMLPICDVRDVALAHLRAMILPEAAGNRHIIVSDHMWYPDVGKFLNQKFGRYGYCIPTRTAPDCLIHLFSLVDDSVKLVLPNLRQAYTLSNRRMREVLKIEPRDVKEILLDTVHGLIECGAVKETRRYKAKKKTRIGIATDAEK